MLRVDPTVIDELTNLPPSRTVHFLMLMKL